MCVEGRGEAYESSTGVFAQTYLTDMGIIMCLNHRESGSSCSLIRTQTLSQASGSTALIAPHRGNTQDV